MSPKLRFTLILLLPFLGFLTLLWFLWQGLSNDPRLLPSALIDHPLPTFQMAALTDPEKTVTPNDLKGDIALLNVWATWCPSCKAEHQTLLGLAEQGVTIYGVNYKDQRNLAVSWLESFGNPYRVNIDDSAGQLGIDLGVYGAPETYLLDQQGVIRYRHVGPLDEIIWQREFLPRIQTIEGARQ